MQLLVVIIGLALFLYYCGKFLDNNLRRILQLKPIVTTSIVLFIAGLLMFIAATFVTKYYIHSTANLFRELYGSVDHVIFKQVIELAIMLARLLLLNVPLSLSWIQVASAIQNKKSFTKTASIGSIVLFILFYTLTFITLAFLSPCDLNGWCL